jgi:hypothetical protein
MMAERLAPRWGGFTAIRGGPIARFDRTVGCLEAELRAAQLERGVASVDT